MLELREVHAGYGAVTVLRGVSLAVRQGTIVAVIGANGAGKSTTLKTISGLIAHSRGEINLAGRNVAGWPPAGIVRAGVAHVPEGRQVFASQSVLDNLVLGGYVHLRKTSRGEWNRRLEQVLDLFPDLKPRLNEPAGALSGGQQQMLAIARGLMARPRLLMMDEPSLGLAPQIIESIFAVVQDLRRQGISILLVEQNARMSLAIADYGYVLEGGVTVLEGTGKELLHNDEVAHRYLAIGHEVQAQAYASDRSQLTRRFRQLLQGF